jgi:hypothetical protein
VEATDSGRDGANNGACDGGGAVRDTGSVLVPVQREKGGVRALVSREV